MKIIMEVFEKVAEIDVSDMDMDELKRVIDFQEHKKRTWSYKIGEK